MRQPLVFNAVTWLTIAAACASAYWLARAETQSPLPLHDPWYVASQPRSLGMQAVHALRDGLRPALVYVTLASTPERTNPSQAATTTTSTR